MRMKRIVKKVNYCIEAFVLFKKPWECIMAQIEALPTAFEHEMEKLSDEEAYSRAMLRGSCSS